MMSSLPRVRWATVVVLSLVAVGMSLLAARNAPAVSKVQGNILTVEKVAGDLLPPTPQGCFNPKPDARTGRLKKRELGKFQAKGTKAKGQGGATIQLVLTNVDCSDASCPGSASNDDGKAGKCTDSNPHLLVLDLETVLLPGLPIKVGVPFDLNGGKSTFPGTGGKNKTDGNTLFGALVTAAFQQANFVLGASVIENGGTACAANAPIPTADPCLTGERYGRLGFVVEYDTELQCTSDANCAVPNECRTASPRICVPIACTADGDCRPGAECDCAAGGGDGECCDPLSEPLCAGRC